LSNILLSRLSLDEIIGDHQCGFRHNRSTTDQIFCIRQKKWEYNETVHQLFIDFKKAYDSVRREVLYSILVEFGVPMKLVRLIKMCLNEEYSKIHIGKHVSDSFPIQNRLNGPKRDEVTGEWRKLHNEELHDLYSSPSIIRIIKARRMRCAGHVARMGEKRNACRLFVGKPEGKRPLGKPRRRWVDNIRVDLVEVGWSDVDGIGLAQDGDRWRALVNSVMNEPSGSMKCWESIECRKNWGSVE
jgi:hypothetical protein